MLLGVVAADASARPSSSLLPSDPAKASDATALFISYGDQNYAGKLARLLRAAENVTGGFTEVRGYNKSDALRLAAGYDETYQLIDSNAGRHNSGWWLFKPLVIYDALSRLPDGGLLVYADAGHVIDFAHQREMPRLKDELHANKSVVLARRLCYAPNGEWTRADVARGIVGDELFDGFMASVSVEASKLMMVKSDTTMEWVQEWRRIALELPEWFTYDPNTTQLLEPNLVGFHDHRHDQSILSALLYRKHIDVRGIGGWLVHDYGPDGNPKPDSPLPLASSLVPAARAAGTTPGWWSEPCVPG